MAKQLFLFVQGLLPLFVPVTAEDGIRGVQYEAPGDGSADTCTEAPIGGPIFAAPSLPVVTWAEDIKAPISSTSQAGVVSSRLTDARFGSGLGGKGATRMAKPLFLFVQVLLPLFVPVTAEDGIRAIQFEVLVDGSADSCTVALIGDQYSKLRGFQSRDG